MPKFVNAKKMHEQHPRTFEVPTDVELDDIKKGDFVKISNGQERFWVEILSRKNKTMRGVVDNELLDDSEYNLGSKITFRDKNVYQIMKKNADLTE